MSITQADRLLSIETPHAYDTLLINSIEGTEALSHPFHYHVHLLAVPSREDTLSRTA